MNRYISQTLNLTEQAVANTLKLLAEGATIPFISRYRKEATGGLDEVQIAAIDTAHKKLVELEKRKETILATIEEQGIKDQMGVFNHQGVIGITYTSSDNFTVVLSLLNSKSIISCKVKGNTLCSLKWDGKDTRHSYLIDLPRYELFEKGDTVYTSGFSSIFPAGIPLGRIERLEDSADGQSYRARVELFVDFADIDNVFVVGHSNREEQEKLEQSIEKSK